MNDKMAAFLGFKAPTTEAPAPAPEPKPEPVKAETTSEVEGENTPAPVEDGPIMKSLKKGRKKK